MFWTKFLGFPVVTLTLLPPLAVVALLVLPNVSRADLIFSEDFSALSGTHAQTETTERRSGDLLTSITLPGWTLGGSTAEILGLDSSGDKAVWLNERNSTQSISRTITGLVPGVQNTLSFEYWGDNVVNNYSFNYQINGTTRSIGATSSGLGTGVFHTETYSFVPTATTTTLRFTETSSNSASPLFDNVRLSAVHVPTTHVLSVGVDWPDHASVGDMKAGLTAQNFASQFRAINPTADVLAVPLDATAPSRANLDFFKSQFATMMTSIQPGDKFILYVGSHGDRDVSGDQIPIRTQELDGSFTSRTGHPYIALGQGALDPSASHLNPIDRLYDDELHQLLSDPHLEGVDKVALLDACRSGGFGPTLTQDVKQVGVLAASPAGGFSWWEDFVIPDIARGLVFGKGQTIFGDALIDGLHADANGRLFADFDNNGQVSILEMQRFFEELTAPHNWLAPYLGQNLNLSLFVNGESAPFSGVASQLDFTPDFNLELVTVPEPSTCGLSFAACVWLIVVRRHTRTRQR